MRRSLLSLFLLIFSTGSLFSASLPEEMKRIEELRGLTFSAPVERQLLRRADLRDFLARQVEKDLKIGVTNYIRVLRALHLVDEGVDIGPLFDLYEAQALAFYDPIGHVFYELDSPPPGIELPEAMEEAIVIHELMHALQDQRFDAGPRMQARQEDWDAGMAYQALIEGEASLVMFAHLAEAMGLSLDQMAGDSMLMKAMTEASGEAIGVPADVPAYYVQSMTFPYLEGMLFVLDAYRAGGWEAVNALHDNPPASTEQLLHPLLYREDSAAGAPVRVQVDSPGEPLLETTLGEFHWKFLLGEQAAKGWGGDAVDIFDSGEDTLTVLLETRWDTPQDAEEFRAALTDFLRSEAAENLWVRIDSNRVRAGYGSEEMRIRQFVAQR